MRARRRVWHIFLIYTIFVSKAEATRVRGVEINNQFDMLLRAEYPFIIFATNKLLSSQKLIMCGTCCIAARRRHIRFESLKYLRKKKNWKKNINYTVNNRYFYVINSCICAVHQFQFCSLMRVLRRGAHANLLKCLSHFILSLFTMRISEWRTFSLNCKSIYF